MQITTRERGTIPNCRPSGHTKSLLEELRIDPDVGDVAQKYYNIVWSWQRHLISESQMWSQLGSLGGCNGLLVHSTIITQML